MRRRRPGIGGQPVPGRLIVEVLQVLPVARLVVLVAGREHLLNAGRYLSPGRERRDTTATHLLQLHTCGHLLRHQSRLNSVKQPLQPADQLRLRDPQLRFRRRFLASSLIDRA